MSLLRDRLHRHLGAATPKAAGQGGEGGAANPKELTGSVLTGKHFGQREEPSENEQEQGSFFLHADDKPSAPIFVEGCSEQAAGEGWEAMEMKVCSNEAGTFLLRRRTYALPYRHGRCELGEFPQQSGELLALSAGTAVEADQVLFLDTETTGLGIGAGNVPFMIGIGYYTEAAFIVEQLFIRNLAEELAMLDYLDKVLARYTHLVTYNGRTFDWPIVQNRFVLNRMELRGASIGQLDFLYPARSLWRHVLSTCKLSVVEEQRLGFTREDDVPGSQAPILYFRYLAEREPGIVEPVFIHNEHDILSLAALAVHLTHALAGRLDDEAMPDEELFRTGVWLDQRGKAGLADRLFERLLARDGAHGANRAAYAAAIAPIYKRRGDERRAVELWQAAIEDFGDALAAPLEPWVELAMYYEHKRKDVSNALHYAVAARERALAGLRLERGASTKQRAAVGELDKRIERLRRKLAGGGIQQRKNGQEPLVFF